MTDELSPQTAPDDAEWEALARYVAGESSPEEAHAVRAWIAADPARESFAALLAPGATALVADPTVDVEAALRRVGGRIDEATVLPFARPTLARAGSRWRSPALRVAAGVAVVIGAGAVWGTSRGSDGGAAAQSYTTAAGRRDSLRLSDGSRVVLGPGSRVDVAAGFGDGAREVSLTGEAYFEVRHDAAHPFTVRAGGATIRDVGTAFVVRTDAGAAARVSVTEGVVDLGAGTERVRLERGDRGALDAAGRLHVERAAVGDADVAFTRGRLVFADAPFDRVRDDVRRWYGIDLRTADSALAARRVTASFDGDQAAHVLEVLGLALGADVARRGDTAVFTPR